MNYYEILEISQHASPEVVKAAYKSLMQRYHPDRNPDNPEIAERASQIIQAYEVISDLTKRAAYDVELKLHDTKIVPGRSAIGKSSPLASTDLSGNKTGWAVWIIILSIIISGWIIISVSKKGKTRQNETQNVQSSLNTNFSLNDRGEDMSVQKDISMASDEKLLNAGADKPGSDDSTKVIYDLVSDFTVNIGSANNLHHVLSIPLLNAKVGSVESEKVIRYIEANKQLIVSKMSAKLANAKYEELIKLDGEQFLKNLILDSIDETAGTDRLKEFPSSGDENPGHYGVTDIILPNSFSVR